MSRRWRRSERVVDPEWVEEGVVGEAEWDASPVVGGWSMTSGAAANRAALARWAAWAVIVAGPLLGVGALLSIPASAGSTVPSAAVQPSAPAPAGTGPAGFAELFVTQYVSAGEGDQSALAAFWPGARSVNFEGAPGRRQVTQIAAVRTIALGGGLWSVTVGARVIEPDARPTTTGTAGTPAAAGPGVRYFQVALASSGESAAGVPFGYSALAAPAEVAAPGQAAAPQLEYGVMKSAAASDVRVQTVGQFLTAYLAGGDLTRFLTPGVQMTGITPAPYTAVAVDQIAAAGLGADGDTAGSRVPDDGTRQDVLVTVRATGGDGTRTPLSYALSLTARAGRWEITALNAAPVPALAPVPTTVPSSSAR
ncbi:conjugal transfer protein [Streptomyces sp. RKAG293]|uniref:conjugal transfer protein n=1 Tax=Streptomyces sp. RKAG293 TaxID=2893403 RepID=UPI0020339C69|nr:conjugal transfer protein [Streptomyces sp. RKAG293]MCM2424153.1 conjugal transfer protein [Streptomyces sp. RKAG293]